jgi:predicted AAA+ superfamily ATPase
MKINRILTDIICDRFSTSNKIVVIYGARQTGKTTLAKDVITRLAQKALLINADEMKYIDVLYPDSKYTYVNHENYLEFIG